MRKVAILTIVLFVLFLVGVFTVNHFQLQAKMNSVIHDDPRNAGVQVSVYYKNYLNPSILVFDLKTIAGTNSMSDVFRVFLQFAHKLQGKKFTEVELASKGNPKFKINGDYFQTLGAEYNSQNPVYTIRTFPEHVMTLQGTEAFPTWTGGWLGVTGKQMEDFNEFHKKWYLDDLTIH